ncbi:MAG: Flp pilus assembly complex ATPase component TadA [Candidatus Omnitrophica bacterium]|nr:Flp pilus assembly complex ATPase component TadA [Candidatus Omnitrophota bacterium]
MMVRKQKKSLGELLREQNIISQIQWDEVRTEERRTGESVRKILLRMGIISEEDLVNFISQQMDMPRIELNNYLIDSAVVDLVPEDLARKHQLIPILKIANNLTCAMVDVFNIYAIDEVGLRTGLVIEPAVATEEEIEKAIEEHYSAKGSMGDVIKSLDEQKLAVKEGDEIEAERLKGMGEEPPVVKLVNMMVAQAVREGASDIHVEPEEHVLKLRFRIDGVLHEKESPPKHFQSAIISRIKILSDMNISERRRPQDGRFQMKMDNHQIDVRVSSVPTVHGENIVMRLLDTSNIILGLDQMGFSSEILKQYQELLKRSNGIILVTGPTGSGKTTTLYASLNSINTPEKGIVTVEDPVEYRLAGVRQIQVNPDVELTFANGLRSILRQDPDVIMIGEIRDLETAEIAVQAALTGHLVFATLHTNNAAGAMARLIDLGVEPFLLSSSIIGIIAQRLLRTLCPDCKGDGCKGCLNTGYKGRIGIYELLIPNENIRELTIKKSSVDVIQKEAENSGMTTLYDDGLEKIKNGLTTKEEVLRVTQER